MSIDRLAINLRAYAHSRGAPEREDDQEVAYEAAGEIIAALAAQPRDDVREADLELSLDWALGVLIEFEPGDSRGVSNEFVSAAAIFSDLDDLSASREILAQAIETRQRQDAKAGLARKGESASCKVRPEFGSQGDEQPDTDGLAGELLALHRRMQLSVEEKRPYSPSIAIDNDEVYLVLRAAIEIESARTDRKAVLEEAAKACEAQQQIFLSEQYAVNQPVSSIPERFACKQCAQAIRALAEGAGK